MAGKLVVKEETPALGWQVVIGTTVLLAIAGGLLFGWQGPEFADPPATANGDTAAQASAAAQQVLNDYASWCIVVAGVLLGAGVGLTLGDYKRTSETTTEVADIAATDAGAGAGVVKETLGILKELSPAKTLIVLSVTLLGLALWTVQPAKPDTTVTVQTR